VAHRCLLPKYCLRASVTVTEAQPFAALRGPLARTIPTPKTECTVRIMQVFRYRIAAASPDSDPRHSDTPLELIDDRPAARRFVPRPRGHVGCRASSTPSTDIVDRSQGWHFNTYSAAPGEYLRDNNWKHCNGRFDHARQLMNIQCTRRFATVASRAVQRTAGSRK
jgi:hypothetical protein